MEPNLKKSRRRKELINLSSRQKRRIRKKLKNNVHKNAPVVDATSSSIDMEHSDTTPGSIFNLSMTGSSSALLPMSRQSSFSDISITSMQSNPSVSESSSAESFVSVSVTSTAQTNFHDELALRFSEHNINHAFGDSLLQLLRSHRCFDYLPKCTKTLLKTPRTTATLLDIPPGQYLDIGFKAAIIDILESLDPDKLPDNLQIDFSTDGANLDNNGNNQLWPLQCRIANIPRSPIKLIGIHRGHKKSDSSEDFLRPFVQEVTEIVRDGGIMFRDSRIVITLRCFIADAPARAFILNHKGHNSGSPCSKCKISGIFVDNHMTLAGVDNALRTDEEYFRQVDEDHHKDGNSSVSLLPMGMVPQVPFEYMHLVCLGVVKRMVIAWVRGSFSKSAKLPGGDVDLISRRLELLYAYFPREFSRPPRKLTQYPLYKATEFRQFLLYTGPVVLHGIVSNEIYNHFLLLSSSMRILTSPHPSPRQLFYARTALRTFVRLSQTLYGITFMSYNVHGLLHLVDDVRTG